MCRPRQPIRRVRPRAGRCVLGGGAVGPILLLLASGCGSDPKWVRIIDQYDPSGAYATRDVMLATLEDLGEVRGTVGQLHGGAKVKLGALIPPKDRGADRDRYIEGAQTVHANWVDDDDVAVATDYDSLAMFTSYAHLEAAVLFFEGFGVAPEAWGQGEGRTPILYEPNILGSFLIGVPESDNAAFVAGLDVFLIMPMDVIPGIPFYMNKGVMAHEYAHRVWYYLAWRGRMVEQAVAAATDPSLVAAFNLLRSADEGAADFFGAAVSDDPRFVAESAKGLLGGSRDLDVTRYVEDSWLTGLEPTASGVYDPYGFGAVLASTLWRMKTALGGEVVAAAVLAAEDALGERLFAGVDHYEAGDFEVELVTQLPAASRCAGCRELEVSYQVAWNRFQGVCACP